MSERTSLLSESSLERSFDSYSSIQSTELFKEGKKKKCGVDLEVVVLKKHLSLLHAVSYIIGGVAGSGIFISPTGVTANVGSVGSSLIIWAVAGVFNILLALCYAELGTALPVAGGDYAYQNELLGPLPAFLTLWVSVLLIGPCSGAVMARTIGEYLFQLTDQGCNQTLVVLLAILVVALFAWLNAVTVKWTARLLTVFSFAKLIALGVIIITGMVLLVQGNTSNFENAFAGSITSPSVVIAGFVPGFVAYCGWDSVNTLAGEMKNPGRDLPLSVTISLVAVTFIYVLTNVAYFTVLTPAEFVASNAVGTSFAMKALPGVAWIIPIFVALSAVGSVNGLFLSFPRYAFAGGQDGQMPAMFGLISLQYFTPIPSIILLFILMSFFCAATFFDLQALLLMLGVIMQIKIALALVALLYLKYYRPHLPRTVKVPVVLVVFSLVALLVIVALALYQEPLINGFGCATFILGIPVYYLGKLSARSPCIAYTFDLLNQFSQQMFLLVPSKKQA